MRVGVLASGAGTNLQALIDRVHRRDTVELVAVGSDRADAQALDRGRAVGLPVRVFAEEDFAGRIERDLAMRSWLEGEKVDLVVLAGYMRLLSPEFLAGFKQRVINVHPSLLPAFPGIRAIEQALDYGVKVFGVTVHFVDEGVDSGSILLQRAVPVPADRDREALERAIHDVEHELLPEAIRLLAAGRVEIDSANPRVVRIHDR